MIKSVCIIGYGSIGKKHHKIISSIFKKEKVYIYSRRKLKIKNLLSNLDDIKKINPDYFIICSETSSHLLHLNMINNNFFNKIILVEKPLSNKKILTKKINNKIFIAYNLRFNQIIEDLKKISNNKKFWYVKIQCSSYLPSWRTNDYKKSYSAIKTRGGGVLFDLSHEIDYAFFLFGKLKIKSVFLKKISNLKINSDDILNFHGVSKNVKNIIISLNYFSKFQERKIMIYGNDIQIEADLLNKFIKIIKNNKIKKQNYKFSQLDSYKKMHINIFRNNFKSFSNFRESINLNNILLDINSK